MLKQERFRQLLSRKMAGEASRAELDELALLISENPDWQIFIEQLATEEEEDPTRDRIEAEAAYAAHAAKMQLSGRYDERSAPEMPAGRELNLPSRGWGWKIGAGIAATLLLALAGVYLFRHTQSAASLPVANEVATKK